MRRSRKNSAQSEVRALSCGVVPMVLSRCQPCVAAVCRCSAASARPSAASRPPPANSSHSSAMNDTPPATPEAIGRGTRTAFAARSSARPAASASNIAALAAALTFTKQRKPSPSSRHVALSELPPQEVQRALATTSRCRADRRGHGGLPVARPPAIGLNAAARRCPGRCRRASAGTSAAPIVCSTICVERVYSHARARLRDSTRSMRRKCSERRLSQSTPGSSFAYSTLPPASTSSYGLIAASPTKIELPVGPVFVHQVPRGNAVEAAADVVAPDVVVDAVVEVERLQMTELALRRREELLAQPDMRIHRAADVEEQQHLDAVAPLRDEMQVEVARIRRGALDRAVHVELLGHAFAREAAQLAQRDLDVARVELDVAVEIPEAALVPHLDRAAVAAARPGRCECPPGCSRTRRTGWCRRCRSTSRRRRGAPSALRGACAAFPSACRSRPSPRPAPSPRRSRCRSNSFFSHSSGSSARTSKIASRP